IPGVSQRESRAEQGKFGMTNKLYSVLGVGGAGLVAACGGDATGQTQEPQTSSGGSSSSGGAAGSAGAAGAPTNCCPAAWWSWSGPPCDCTGGVCCWLSPSNPKCANRCP